MATASPSRHAPSRRSAHLAPKGEELRRGRLQGRDERVVTFEVGPSLGFGRCSATPAMVVADGAGSRQNLCQEQSSSLEKPHLGTDCDENRCNLRTATRRSWFWEYAYKYALHTYIYTYEYKSWNIHMHLHLDLHTHRHLILPMHMRIRAHSHLLIHIHICTCFPGISADLYICLCIDLQCMNEVRKTIHRGAPPRFGTERRRFRR